MSRPSLLKSGKELRPYIEGISTRKPVNSRRVSVDGRKRYENGSVDADQLLRFR